MPIPQFIQDLRVDIGQKLLPVMGANGIVLDERDRVLLNRRSDNGRWWLPGGILEPGEQPAAGLIREVYEETAVEIEVEQLTSVISSPPSLCSNGDIIQSLTLTFRARAIGGEARVNDDESLEVAWFTQDALPELTPKNQLRLKHALAGEPRTYFET
jgi:ADP-ribose pyrophosphatase YjhB (NUDIX family)